MLLGLIASFSSPCVPGRILVWSPSPCPACSGGFPCLLREVHLRRVLAAVLMGDSRGIAASVFLEPFPPLSSFAGGVSEWQRAGLAGFCSSLSSSPILSGGVSLVRQLLAEDPSLLALGFLVGMSLGAAVQKAWISTSPPPCAPCCQKWVSHQLLYYGHKLPGMSINASIDGGVRMFSCGSLSTSIHLAAKAKVCRMEVL